MYYLNNKSSTELNKKYADFMSDKKQQATFELFTRNAIKSFDLELIQKHLSDIDVLTQIIENINEFLPKEYIAPDLL